MAEPAAEDKKNVSPPAGNNLMPMLIAAVVLAVLLGGTGFALAYFVLPARLASQMSALQAAAPASGPAAGSAPPQASAAPASSSSTTPIDKEHSERTPEELAAQGGKTVTKFTVEEVTVNIAETRGSRFVRAGAYFEAEPPVLEELEANRARIIDTFAQILSSKTLDQLTSPTARGILREELLGTINPTLKEGRVDNIYFTDLLVQ